MKLLFIQHGSRIYYSKENEVYVDACFNNEIWKRYASYCDELHVVLREVNERFDEEYLSNRLNKIDRSILKLKTIPDIYKPKKNYLNFKIRKQIDKTIEEEVRNVDKVILRSAGDFYTDIALKYCKKYNKPYLIEAVGFPFDSFWYHSFVGKFIALPIDIKFKKAVRDASYVLYVTNEALQKKYPSKGKMLGCSDVEVNLSEQDIEEIITKRMQKQSGPKIKLGTAAFLNVKWKGQRDVFKALYELKENGISNFEYELIGSGDSSNLLNEIKKYGLEEQIKIVGALPHSEVFNWLDNIDIYVQPSYQEGLCRAIVEAMSRGCAVICTDVGGNYELIDRKYIYKKGNVNQLVDILSKIKKEDIIEQSNINIRKASSYNQKQLNIKRDRFYMEFTEKNEEN